MGIVTYDDMKDNHMALLVPFETLPHLRAFSLFKKPSGESPRTLYHLLPLSE